MALKVEGGLDSLECAWYKFKSVTRKDLGCLMGVWFCVM